MEERPGRQEIRRKSGVGSKREREGCCGKRQRERERERERERGVLPPT